MTKAVSALRSPDQATRKKALQRLHIRWWHASTEQLTRTLTAAGVLAEGVADIPAVVQCCLICRDWRSPGPRNMATFRLTMEFNEEVKFDLMYFFTGPELNLRRAWSPSPTWSAPV